MNNKYPHQGIAQLLANKGRQGDTMLVHMAPVEVAALQKIAENQGTSLTINPHTGLPEAVSLNPFSGHSSGGVGAAFAGLVGGAFGIDPGVMGLITGASQWISQGNFEDGLVAGLSAYGGAELGGSLSNWAQNKINLFKEGYGSTSPTMPTLGGKGISANPLDVATGPEDYQDIMNSSKYNVAPSNIAMAATPEAYQDMMNAGQAPAPVGLKTPEQIQNALTKPATIEAQNAAQNKWYIPDAIENSKVYKGLANMAKAPTPTPGGVTGVGGAGGPNNAGGNAFNAYQLATLGASVDAAKKQDEAAKAQDEKDRAAATPTPYTFTSGVGFHQVRNPLYGKKPGQPMYIQYYDKGTAGPNYTGPGQSSVRDMTPTELQKYEQTGQFVPGAAQGGLAGLIPKKVEAFAAGGSTNLADLQNRISSEYAYANRTPLPKTGPQTPAYFQWLRGDFDLTDSASKPSAFTYPSYTAIPSSTTTTSTYNTFTSNTNTFDSSTYTTPPSPPKTIDTSTYTTATSSTIDTSTYTTATSSTLDTSTYDTLGTSSTVDTTTYDTLGTSSTVDTTTYDTLGTSSTVDTTTYDTLGTSSTTDSSTYSSTSNSLVLDGTTYTTTDTSTTDSSTYTTATSSSLVLDGTTYTTTDTSTTNTSTYSTVGSSTSSLDTSTFTPPPPDPFTTNTSTYDTVGSSTSSFDTSTFTPPSDPFTTNTSTYNTFTSSTTGFDSSAYSTPANTVATAVKYARYAQSELWFLGKDGSWYDMNDPADYEAYYAAGNKAPLSTEFVSHPETTADTQPVSDIRSDPLGGSGVYNLNIDSERQQYMSLMSLWSAAHSVKISSTYSTYSTYTSSSPTKTTATNTSTTNTSTYTSATNTSTYTSTTTYATSGTYNTITSSSYSSTYSTPPGSSSTSLTIYKTVDQYGNPVAIPDDWKNLDKSNQSFLSKVWNFLTTPLFKNKLSESEAWNATMDFMRADGKSWSSNATLLVYNALRAGLLGPGVALATNAFSMLTGFGFNHPNISKDDPKYQQILKGLANANPVLGMDENVLRLIGDAKNAIWKEDTANTNVQDGYVFDNKTGQLISGFKYTGGLSWDEGFDPSTGTYQESTFNTFSKNTNLNTFIMNGVPVYTGNDNYARALSGNGDVIYGTISKLNADGSKAGVDAYYTPIKTGAYDAKSGRTYLKDFGLVEPDSISVPKGGNKPYDPKVGYEFEEVLITANPNRFYTKAEYEQDQANQKAAWEAAQKKYGYDPSSGKTELIVQKDYNGTVTSQKYVTKDEAFNWRKGENLTPYDQKLLALYGNINPNDIINRGIDAIIGHDYSSTTDSRGIPVEGSLFNARGELVGVNNIDSSTGFIGKYFDTIGMTNNTWEAADALRLAQARLVEYRKDNFLDPETGEFDRDAWDANYRQLHGGLSYEEDMAKLKDFQYNFFRKTYVDTGLFPLASLISKYGNQQYDEEGNPIGESPLFKNYESWMALDRSDPDALARYVNKTKEIKPIVDELIQRPELLAETIRRLSSDNTKSLSLDDIIRGLAANDNAGIRRIIGEADHALFEAAQADTGQWQPGWGQYDPGYAVNLFGSDPNYNMANWVGDTGYGINVGWDTSTSTYHPVLTGTAPYNLTNSNFNWSGPNTYSGDLYKTSNGNYYSYNNGTFTLQFTTNPDGTLNWYKPVGNAGGGLIGLAQGGGIVGKDKPYVQHFANQGAVDNDMFGGLQTGLYASKTQGKSGITDLLPEIKAAKRGSPPSVKSAATIRNWTKSLSGTSDSDTESDSPLIAYIKSLSGTTDKEDSSKKETAKYAPGGEIMQNGYDEVPPGYYPASGGDEGPGGHLLSGPGDGMSDSIDAMITGEEPQRAALADGEFVISADVVSHIGNGSTKAGAAKLYDLMDQIRKARTGTTEQAPQINADKYLNKLR
jgi:hypothetical protein